MEYTLEEKIEMNKERLREEINNLKSIQNTYPLYIAYLGFIGIYYFDVIEYLSHTDWGAIEYLFVGLTVIIGVFVILSFYNFFLQFSPSKIAYEKVPKALYKNYRDELEEFYESRNKEVTEKQLEKEVSLGYLEGLEVAVGHNFQLYTKKKKHLYWAIFLGLISIIPYIALIVLKIMLT